MALRTGCKIKAKSIRKPRHLTLQYVVPEILLKNACHLVGEFESKASEEALHFLSAIAYCLDGGAQCPRYNVQRERNVCHNSVAYIRLLARCRSSRPTTSLNSTISSPFLLLLSRNHGRFRSKLTHSEMCSAS
jgi:hypothetical protein